MSDKQALIDFMQQHLPIAKDIGFEVKSFTGTELCLAAPLAPNINDKLSAFGGSLYCVCVMACWGMVYLQALKRGVEMPNIAVAKADIRYKGPVLEDFEAVCLVEDETVFESFVEQYRREGKARINLRSVVTKKDKTLVELNGEYVLYQP